MSVSTYNIIYQIVCQIPKGRVATYAQVADLANLYGKARKRGLCTLPRGYALRHPLAPSH